MKKSMQLLKSLANKNGSIVVFIALGLIMLLGVAALAVDIGHITVTKNELQNISDAASLAATRQLGAIYETIPYENIDSFVADPAPLIAIAKDVGLKNQAGKRNITINDADVIIGTWVRNRIPPFEATLNQPDAVKVIARRSSSSAEGPISNIFAKIFGKETTNVGADAIAALTPQSTAGPGGLPVPAGISSYWFRSGFCNQPIRFYPTNDPTSCAGWHVYDRYSNAPDSRLRATINDLENWSYQSPDVIAGETQFEFTNGTMSTQTFEAMKLLFDSRKVMNDGIVDNDLNSSTWTTSVPVYDLDDCGPMQGARLIVGFATIVITNVQDAPVHQIDGYVICEMVAPGRGGGGEYGTKGSIPGLVE